MRKLFAFILAVIFTATIANFTFILKGDNSNNLEKVVVKEVIDGDTLILEDGRTVRLVNINAPEKSSPLSSDATSFLSKLTGQTIYIESLGLEKYGRTLARIYSSDYINLKLVEIGFASKFLVNEEEIKNFYKAEEKAISSQLGMWHSSIYSSCVKTKVYSKEEYVEIENSCSPINISGWMVKDESRKVYKFEITLDKRIILHSGKGKDEGDELYWQQSANVWNNDRDTLYFFDSENNLVSHYSYGY